MDKSYAGAASAMGAEADKPAKKVNEIRIRHSANGGHIIEHHHTHHSHPVEEHTTKGDDALAGHVMDTMGTPNPGEAAADAGAPEGPAGAAGASPAMAAPPQM